MSDAFLRHVCRRIDALTYDEHSQYLLGSLRAADVPLTPAAALSGSSVASTSTPLTRAPTPRGSLGAGTVTVSSRRRRAHPQWAKLVGLTSYYVRFVLLLGVGWYFAMVGIFVFLYAFSVLSEADVPLAPRAHVLAVAMYFASGAAGCLLFGSLADHYGRRRVLLLAAGEWIAANALTGAAWGPTSLLALRALASLGLGGEFVLLVTISLEYTPKRTRGRITVVSLGLATVGIVASVAFGHACVRALTWRGSFGVVSGAALLYLALLLRCLNESPKYLASTGRSAEALRVLAAMETAHGIDRQARVTVPTSLYAPRPHPQPPPPSSEPLAGEPQASADRRRALTELYRQPHHADFDARREETGGRRTKRSTRRESGDSELHHALGFGVSPDAPAAPAPDAPVLPPAVADGMAPGVVSFAQSLRLRLTGVLLRAPLLRRTLLLWLLWFATCLSVSAALVAMIVRAQLERVGSLRDQLIWSAATVPGILLAAVLVERAGRKSTLAVFLVADGVAMAAVAALLSASSGWAAVVWSTAFLSFSVTGTLCAICVFTGEQYPLMVRALGMGLAAAAGHLGLFAGVYVVMRLVLDADWQWAELRVAVAAASGVALLVALPLAALTGVETRGHDVDTLEWHTLNARKRRRRQRHQRDFEDAASSGSGAGSQRAVIATAGVDARHASRAGSLENSAMLAAPTRSKRALSTPVTALAGASGLGAVAVAHRSSLPVLMASSSSCGSSADGLPASPASPPPVSASLSPSSVSSSSSSSGFWQKRSVHRLRRQVKAVADAVRARKTLSISSLSSASAAKKARALTGSSRSTTRPSDDLDMLDMMVTDHELDADGGYAHAYGRRRRTASGLAGRDPRRRTRTSSSSGAHSRWFVPSLSSESVMSIGRWRQSSSAASPSSSSASSSSSLEPLEPPVPRAKRKSSRAHAASHLWSQSTRSRSRSRSRRPTDPEPVLEILEPSAFTDSGRFLLPTEEESKAARGRCTDAGSKSSGDESQLSIDLVMFDTFTSISTPARGAR